MLEINEGDSVTIKQIENAIINRAFDDGWVVPMPPELESGRSVAVVGSGPAGLAAAQQLRRAGHGVVVFERDEAAGGLVRFGVPDFKIEKWIVQRRIDQLVAEGVEFRFGVDVGVDVDAQELRAEFDAIVLAIGSRVPRDLRCRGASCRARTSRWSTSTRATAGRRRSSARRPTARRRRSTRSAPPAGTSS